jgi:pimeloyl-ACP methyl ester carboxylesterase
MLVAAAHPDLMCSLVVIEGSPDGPESHGAGAELADSIRRSLSAWPVPFADELAAEEFFQNKGFDPVVWTGGLEHRDDGLWPKWDLETMVNCMADLGSRNYWPQWRSIQSRTLVVLGENGIFPPGHGDEMIAQLPNASLTVITGAGHDVHLDAPKAWAAALRGSRAG